MTTNFEKTVAAMQPADMELLIRAYVKHHIRSLGDGYDQQVYWTLGGGTVRGGKNPDSAKWSVYSGSSDHDTTKGEVLAVVAAEFYRRKGWTASNVASLLLIEGTVATEVPAATEEESF